MRISLTKLGRLLLSEPGLSSEGIDARMKARGNKTASNNYYNVARMMRALGVRDVLQLFRKNAAGGYDVAAWIDEGKLPGGKADPGHALKSPASRMSYYNSLGSISNPNKLPGVAEQVDPEAREFIGQRAQDLSREVKDAQLENRLSSRELATILPWLSIQEMYRAGRGGLDPQERLLADMYLCCYDSPEGAPRRLDYGEVYVHYSGQGILGDGENRVIVNRETREVTLVLENFKTYRHYGAYSCALPKRLSGEIIKSLRSDPRDVLFYKQNGSGRRAKAGMSANTFGVRLSAVMEKLTGKAIGVSNLRKSFITWLYNSGDKSEKVLREYAHAMGHSPEMARIYRKINIDESENPDLTISAP